MKLQFIPAVYKLEFELPKNFFEILEKTFSKGATIALYSAVNFHNKFDFVVKLLEKKGFKVLTSKPDRCSKIGQILGCVSNKENLNLELDKIDGFVYIGDGYFHPNALLFCQEGQEKIKPIVLGNVVQQITEVLTENHISKYLKKRKGVMLKFLTSKNIGVFISTKWGQSYEKTALKLKDKYKDKKFYFFIGDNFMDNEMENFPYVECFVNTACPRIGQDDILRHTKAVVNIKDIL